MLHAGAAELVLKETLYELDRPELITVTEAGMVPPQVAAPFDHLGWRYVRLHVVESRPGSFETSPDAVPEVDTTGIPVEPRMVEREGALA